MFTPNQMIWIINVTIFSFSPGFSPLKSVAQQIFAEQQIGGGATLGRGVGGAGVEPGVKVFLWVRPRLMVWWMVIAHTARLVARMWGWIWEVSCLRSRNSKQKSPQKNKWWMNFLHLQFQFPVPDPPNMCDRVDQLPLFPYNRGWETQPNSRGLYTHYKDSLLKGGMTIPQKNATTLTMAQYVSLFYLHFGCRFSQAAVATGATDEWRIPPWPWAILSWLASLLEPLPGGWHDVIDMDHLREPNLIFEATQNSELRFPTFFLGGGVGFCHRLFFLPFAISFWKVHVCFQSLLQVPVWLVGFFNVFQVGLPGSLWWLLGGERD